MYTTERERNYIPLVQGRGGTILFRHVGYVGRVHCKLWEYHEVFCASPTAALAQLRTHFHEKRRDFHDMCLNGDFTKSSKQGLQRVRVSAKDYLSTVYRVVVPNVKSMTYYFEGQRRRVRFDFPNR